jgi:hypothetical protein
MRGDVMKTIGRIVAGLVAGVAALAAVWLLWPSASERAPIEAPVAAEVAPIAADPMAALDAKQRRGLMRWLAANPLYALIVHDYCACADAQNENPYVAVGDFNSDARSDLAVLLGFKDGTAGPVALFIFNGPFSGDAPTVAFTTSGWARNDVLYAGGTLFVGPPNSDNGYSLVPKGQTYELRYEGDGG